MFNGKLVVMSYYGGWMDTIETPDNWDFAPWNRLKPYPEKEPQKGWYPEEQQWVIDMSNAEAKSGGVDCWYFNYYAAQGVPTKDHALRNYVRSRVKGPNFFVSFETATTFQGKGPIENLDHWNNICDDIAKLIDSKKYQMIPGTNRPIVGMGKLSNLIEVVAPKTGKTVFELLAIMRKRCGRNIYFLALDGASMHWTMQALLNGFEGYGCYNLFFKTNHSTNVPEPTPTTFVGLDDVYRTEVAWLDNRLKALRAEFAKPIELWAPFTRGWDSRSLQGGNLIGVSTEAELNAHLKWFADFTKANPENIRALHGCAWNEHTEGSVFEPSKAEGRMALGCLLANLHN
jgi:hypothetical protein